VDIYPLFVLLVFEEAATDFAFCTGKIRECRAYYTGLFEKNINFQKFILQKLLALNPCPVYGWKGNLSSPDIYYLKQRITDAVAAVICDILQRVWEELDYRFDICRVTLGAHIEYL
jgi:hypothetical protein